MKKDVKKKDVKKKNTKKKNMKKRNFIDFYREPDSDQSFAFDITFGSHAESVGVTFLVKESFSFYRNDLIQFLTLKDLRAFEATHKTDSLIPLMMGVPSYSYSSCSGGG